MNKEEITIRKTITSDLNDIVNIHQLAFPTDQTVAELTEGLLSDTTSEPMVSLIALHNDKAVGHILFTRAYFENQEEEQPLMHILAPLGILPNYQRQNIGGMLIKAGLEILKEMNSKVVFVLGHKEYYPRHGFQQNAQGMGYFTPYPDPMPAYYAEYWMVQFLTQENIGKRKIKCADAMNKPEYWRDEETDKNHQ